MNPFSLSGSELLNPSLSKDKSGSKDKVLVAKKPDKPQIGGHRKKPDPVPEAAEPELVSAEPTEKAKDGPKVNLHGLKWDSDQGVFNEKIQVHAKADLPPELKGITRIEFKVLALTPDGKKEPIDKQEAHLKEGNASSGITLFIPAFRQDGKMLSECKYIFTAKHRDSKEEESPCLVVKQPFATNIRWDKAEEWFGLPVKLLADTCLKDGEQVGVKVASENGVALDAKVKVKGGKIELPWEPCLCGVTVDADGKFPDKVVFYTELSHSGEKAVPKKNFLLKVLGDSDYQDFSKDYTWGIFGVHAEFKQRLVKGAVDVQVRKTVMKAWPGYLVDMNAGGITGLAGGCPYDGCRWGRIIGTSELPNEYFDGKKWLAMPDDFLPTDDDVSVYGFIKAGAKYHMGGDASAPWPEKFKDYDFDCDKYKKKRKDWKADTDSRWSGKFLIRPKPCPKGIGKGGCGYPVDLDLELKRVEKWETHTIALCNGAFRSNAGCFSMEDEDIEMVAHEVGHLVGLPDEYEGGGVDPAINGDGAVDGIDDTTVMGTKMDLVKKRHYINFVAVTEKLVGAKTGKKAAFAASEI
jgi:hypothetical protein